MTCPSGLVPSSNSRTVFDGRHDGATGDEGDSTTDRRLIRASRSMRPEEGTTSARMHRPATYRSEADSGVDFPWTSDHRWTTGYDTSDGMTVWAGRKSKGEMGLSSGGWIRVRGAKEAGHARPPGSLPQ